MAQYSQHSSFPSLKAVFAMPLFTILCMAIPTVIEQVGHASLDWMGIMPRNPQFLVGILLGPLHHGDWMHLASNGISLFLFGSALYFFYWHLATKVWFIMYVSTAVLVWGLARGNTLHIGISGFVYALAFFLFISGIVRRNRRLAVLSLLLALFYGSMVYGILPNQPGVSWESHLIGALVGVVTAVYYRHSPSGVESFDQPLPEAPDVIGDAWMSGTDAIVFKPGLEKESLPSGLSHDWNNQEVVFQYHAPGWAVNDKDARDRAGHLSA
jgi:membrane associated rhomboid family serine protease